MKISEGESLNYVSRRQYKVDSAKRFSLSQIEQDEEYKARLVIDSGGNEIYAADFLVVVNEIIKPKKRRFSWVSPKIIKLSL